MSLVVFMPTITTNHAITYSNYSRKMSNYDITTNDFTKNRTKLCDMKELSKGSKTLKPYFSSKNDSPNAT